MLVEMYPELKEYLDDQGNIWPDRIRKVMVRYN
jgi:hypothetical protein